eukprot:TRINITY_DN32550_c0_g1_i1.p1 TRINITY_DN32550_c0_g1~~TRINITY_DN32550_c0_g1_i1.p1  ORF type:complete len:118 (+),score=20.82 TRINITY_DN32550_c0_g1_i1:46-399(+)
MSTSSYVIGNQRINFAAPSSLPATMRRSRSAPEVAVMEKAKLLSFLAEKARLHQSGLCKPCSFFARKGDGCRLGNTCKLCHSCTAEQIKEKRRLKRATAAKDIRLEIEARSTPVVMM